jgi:hypothetical protein
MSFTFKLQPALEELGFTLTDIKRIYHGKDEYCRCGCGGRYFSNNSRGFALARNKMINGVAATKVVFDTQYRSWLNVSLANQDNKCYCIYFTKD